MNARPNELSTAPVNIKNKRQKRKLYADFQCNDILFFFADFLHFLSDFFLPIHLYRPREHFIIYFFGFVQLLSDGKPYRHTTPVSE